MKTLTLVRHGKSSWKFDVSDELRPLKSRGITDVISVSKEFKTMGLSMEAVFSSPAKRAIETCNIFLKNTLFLIENVKLSSQLYDFNGVKLVSFIKSIDNSYNNVMIFGHNNAFTNFTNTYGDVYVDNLPTSGLVIFKFDITDWKDLKPGKIVKIIIPKYLR